MENDKHTRRGKSIAARIGLATLNRTISKLKELSGFDSLNKPSTDSAPFTTTFDID